LLDKLEANQKSLEVFFKKCLDEKSYNNKDTQELFKLVEKKITEFESLKKVIQDKFKSIEEVRKFYTRTGNFDKEYEAKLGVLISKHESKLNEFSQYIDYGSSEDFLKKSRTFFIKFFWLLIFKNFSY
jgi:predicted nucleotide-binding protein (sugar kinase/HSP70/actin superfamily)